jgi:hypothetical protein
VEDGQPLGAPAALATSLAAAVGHGSSNRNTEEHGP